MTEDKEDKKGKEQKFKFLKGKESAYLNDNWKEWAENVRKDISEVMNAKNVAFLLGSGCSSLKRDDKEIGIATMLPLAEEFCNAAGKIVDSEGDEDWKSWCLTVEEKRYLCDNLKVLSGR